MSKPANRIEEKGGRVLLFGTFYTAMKRKLMELADNKCERCGKFTLQGDVEHIVGRGGGKRDDRIFVNGKRNLEYLCQRLSYRSAPGNQASTGETYRQRIYGDVGTMKNDVHIVISPDRPKAGF
jgi:hypothetical protein